MGPLKCSLSCWQRLSWLELQKQKTGLQNKRFVDDYSNIIPNKNQDESLDPLRLLKIFVRLWEGPGFHRQHYFSSPKPKNIYPIGNQYHGRFKTAIDLKIQCSNISCPSCSENMLLGWFTGVTKPFRLGLGSSQHGTQLRIANGIRNGLSPLVKATKYQNTVTEKNPCNMEEKV